MISKRSPTRASRPTRAWFVIFGIISTLSILPASASHAADTHDSIAVDLSAYEGHWQRVEKSESNAARKIAIEKAVKGLSWIVRRMAGGVLRRSTAPPPELQFAWDGERLHQGLADENGGFSRRIELDGQLRSLKDSRGEDFSAAWAWTGEGLRLRWEQHQANGHNLYRLEEDAHTLIVEHTIKVTAISNVAPIVFLSRFSRTTLPARAAAGLDQIARVARD